MSTAFTARRRADEFNELIERASVAPLDDTRFSELADVLTTLRQAQPVLPRREFAGELRSRLMAAAQTALTPETAAQVAARRPSPRRTGRDKKVAAVLGGFAIVTASTSMAVAAQTALPGDTLYPLKRAIENAHANVQSGDDKGTTLLSNANSRLQEVDALSRSGAEDPLVIAQTLQAFTDQATEASSVLLGDYRTSGHLSSLQQLRAFTADSIAMLNQLSSEVPPGARASLIQAAQILKQIDQQALAACPGCTVSSIAPLLASADLPEILRNLVEPILEQQPTTKHDPAKKHHDAKPSNQTSHTDGPSDPSQPTNPLNGPPDTSASGNPHQSTNPLTPITEPITHLGTTASTGHGLKDLIKGVDTTITDLLGGH